MFSDIDTWKLKIDQDIIPEWYNEEEYKPQVVEAVKEWAKTHIHIGVDGLRISAGHNHYIKDCKNVTIYGNATVGYICGNATVKNICGNATVKNICGNATVKRICDNSSPNSKWDNATTVIIAENATFKDCYTETIHQAGNWKLISVESGEK